MARTKAGRALRDARAAAGVSLDYAAVYTQIKLGKSMGISREQLRKMESDLVAPKDWNAAALLALADCYGVPVERIMPPEVERAGLRFLASATRERPTTQQGEHGPDLHQCAA